MTHYMTGAESADYSANTEKFNMHGAGLVPSKTKCFACGKHKTTQTGKVTAKDLRPDVDWAVLRSSKKRAA